jgi:hypothetical protein
LDYRPTLEGLNKTNLCFSNRPIDTSFIQNAISIMQKIDDVHYGDPKYTITDEEFPPEAEALIINSIFECFTMEQKISYEVSQMIFFFVLL